MNFRIIKKNDGKFYAEMEKRSWFGTHWYPALEISYTLDGAFNRPFDTEKQCRAELKRRYLTPDVLVWEGVKP